MRAIAALLGAIVLVAGMSFASMPSAAGESIVTEVLTERPSYTLDEPVDVTIVVRNTGSQSISMWFPTSLIAYYTVEDDKGNVIFNLRFHVYVLMVLTELTLGPGESREFVYNEAQAWPQEDDDGKPVDYPGEYTIFGRLDGMESGYEVGQTTVTISSSSPFTEDVPEFSSVAAVALSMLVIVFLMRRKKGRGAQPEN